MNNDQNFSLYLLFLLCIGGMIGLLFNGFVPYVEFRWEEYQISKEPHQCCTEIVSQNFEDADNIAPDHFEDPQDSPQTPVQRDEDSPPTDIREGIYGISGL